jgi:hypothetical protein
MSPRRASAKLQLQIADPAMTKLGKALFRAKSGALLVEDQPGAMSRHIWLSPDRCFTAPANAEEVELARTLRTAIEALEVYASRDFWTIDFEVGGAPWEIDQGARARLTLQKVQRQAPGEVESPS